MELSKRLKAVANMVSLDSVVCDVGCDHGYVPIYLVQEKRCKKIIAMDVNEGPLAQAREHIRAAGLGEYIETRLSDGMTALSEKEADTLILAGMGGRLVIRILTEGSEKLAAMKELILQPQSEIRAVREYLRMQGYHICQEDMVFEDGKYYPMMKAIKVTDVSEKAGAALCEPSGHVDVKETMRVSGSENAQTGSLSDICQEAYDRYGALLLRNRHPQLKQFLLWEQKKDEAVLAALLQGAAFTEKGKSRRQELERAAAVRAYALSFFDKDR